MTSFDLRSAKLRSGEEHREAIDVGLEPIELGGQRYVPAPETVPAALTVSRATTGTVFELAFDARLHGPCVRCLADAALDLRIRSREYQATKATNADSDELRTPYLADGKLDLSAWARDSVVLALPEQILCRPECAGLCPECGRDLNVEPHVHDEERVDSRWSALEGLRDTL